MEISFQCICCRDPLWWVRAGGRRAHGEKQQAVAAQHQRRAYRCFLSFLLNNPVAVSAPFWSGQHLHRASSANWYSPKPRGADVSPDLRGLSHSRPEAFPPGVNGADLLYLKAASVLSPPWTRKKHRFCWLIRKQCGLASVSGGHSVEFAVGLKLSFSGLNTTQILGNFRKWTLTFSRIAHQLKALIQGN